MINDEITSRPESSSAGSVKESVRETKDRIKAKASEAATHAKDRGREYLREGKERTANRIEGYSESMRHAAERFEREQDPNLAHYTGLLADRLERAASYVRDRDLRAVQHDAEDLARRHPAIFFGGMFVAGLAAARFLKASADRPETSWSSRAEEEEYANEPGLRDRDRDRDRSESAGQQPSMAPSGAPAGSGNPGWAHGEV